MGTGMLRFAATVMATISMISLSALASAQPNGGQRLYLQYCSACHGTQGKGDGVVSGLMQPKPPDLTLLARRNGGTFPTVAVLDTIDGRSSLRAHGDPDMPVWGAILRSDAGDAKNPDQVVHSVIAQITDYLRAIQAR